MPSISFSDPDGVNLSLPDFLFYRNSAGSKSVSPTASLDPAYAFSDKPFASTSPSSEFNKKTIVIDSSSFPGIPNPAESIALIARLKNAGFQIYLCVVDSNFLKVENDLKGIGDNLDKLRKFDQATDHAIIAQTHQVEIDKMLLLGRSKRLEIEEGFAAEYGEEKGCHFSADALRCDFRKFSDDLIKRCIEDESNANSYKLDSGTKVNSSTLLFFLFHSSDKKRIDLLKTYFLPFRSSVPSLARSQYSDADWSFCAEILQLLPQSEDPLIKDICDKIFSILPIDGILYCLKELPRSAARSLKSSIDKLLLDKRFKPQEVIALKMVIDPDQTATHIAEASGDVFSFKNFKIYLLAISPKHFCDLMDWFPSDEIEGRHFRTILESAPQYAAPLIERFSSKPILSALTEPLIEILDRVPKDQVDEIIKHLITRIKLPDFAIILRAAPQKAKELIEKHASRLIIGYKGDKILSDILDCAGASPDNANLILEKAQECGVNLGGSNDKMLDKKISFLRNLSHPEIIKGIIKNLPIDLWFCFRNDLDYIALSEAIIKNAADYPQAIVDIFKSTEFFLGSSFFKAPDLIVETKIKIGILSYVGKFRQSIPSKLREFVNFLIDATLQIGELSRCSEVAYELIHSHDFKEAAVTKNRPTLLHITDLDEAGLTEIELRKSDLSKVAVLRIIRTDSPKCIKKILDILPNIKHLTLPQSLRDSDDLADLLSSHSHDFVDYDKYHFSVWPTSIELFPSVPLSTSKTSSDIMVAIGALEEKMNATSSNSLKGGDEYTMTNAGEVLNKNIAPQIRTTIISRDITKNLKQKEYLPSSFMKVADPKILEQPEIDDFKSRTDGTYYRFNLPLREGKKFRLLSASQAEELVGIMTDNGAKVEIEKGDDDFFYATADKNCIFSHVTKVAHDAHKSYELMPAKNPIGQIIEEYRSGPRFKKTADELSALVKDYASMSHKGWLEDLFKNRSGSCRHRVAAVEYKLRNTAGISPKDIRVVDINGDHVILEVRDGGVWYSADLGGAPYATIIQSEQPYTSDPVQQSGLAEVDDSEKSKTTEKESIQRNLGAALERLLELQKVSSSKELQSKIHGEKRALIVTNKTDSRANQILAQAKSEGRPVYYIDSPEKIDIARKSLFLPKKDGAAPIIKPSGLLQDFLNDCGKSHEYATSVAGASSEEKTPLLLINWDTFDSRQKVMLNTLLDPDSQRTISGVKIPDRVRILGLCNATPKDPSFLSRHNICLSANFNEASPIHPTTGTEIEIDLQGFPNWRRELFGRVVLVGDKMEWQKSEFVKAIEAGQDNFTIKNLSFEAAKELKYEVAQAKALGSFNYHGYSIDLPQSFSLNSIKSAFDFSKFSAPVKTEITYDKTPEGCQLINSYLFDSLLQNKVIEEEKYTESAGLLDQFSGQNLKLFISSNLSDSQWYCLFYQAESKGVNLELYLAPQVAIPAINKLPLEEKVGEEFSTKAIGCKIYVSNDTNKTTKTLLTGTTDLVAASPIVIDVEDYTYQDLIERISFKEKEDGSGFENFKKSESALWTRIRDGEPVIIKGKFAPDLLQMLHPLLVGEFPNLTIIIEEESLTPEVATYTPLAFLPKESYEIRFEEKSLNPEREIYRETLDTSKLDASSKKNLTNLSPPEKTNLSRCCKKIVCCK